MASAEIAGGVIARRCGKSLGDGRRELGHVREPVAQARHPHLDHVDAVIEVLAESPRRDQLAEVAVGRREDAHVDRLLALVADRARGLFLDQAQELHLHDERQVRHLVEEERAAFRGLHEAELVGDRAGEAAAAVAEELAFHELRRDRAAADGHERRVLARAGLVDQPRDQLLAGAGLAGDVHGRLAARHAADHGAQPLHRLGIAEQAPSAIGGAPAVGELERLVDELAQVRDVYRLPHEVEGAELQREHGGFHVAVGRDHGNRQLRRPRAGSIR